MTAPKPYRTWKYSNGVSVTIVACTPIIDAAWGLVDTRPVFENTLTMCIGIMKSVTMIEHQGAIVLLCTKELLASRKHVRGPTHELEDSNPSRDQSIRCSDTVIRPDLAHSLLLASETRRIDHKGL